MPALNQIFQGLVSPSLYLLQSQEGSGWSWNGMILKVISEYRWEEGPRRRSKEGDWLFGPHAFPTHWLTLPMPCLPQRVSRLPATSDSPQPPPAARLLQAWHSPTSCLEHSSCGIPRLISYTSLRSLPKCRFPREDFPVKKRRRSLSSVKNSAPHCLKALTLLCLHSTSLQICSSL